ncbi:ankyrin repeat domain-containing protein [Chloropicon primus]|uniref:Uncharacterized protein n=1 Tax=Chloropicon primus TaxID=1764295 RepID=A0A5B8MTJ7_9CHLO|nr:hypothetical protein A3770_08p52680 [Chloropicon primus]UPR01974.1 ankyrin repeat domain-containing protein [Chloropicon primus]|eukprot:QDZ22750.1 hypothetical protein A3770_08p52680 [Chloropicon primus]
MSNRWKNIQNAFRLANPPTSTQRHEVFQIISEGKSADVVKALNEYESDEGAESLAELRDERKRTALHWAAMSTSERSVSDVLIEKGCKVDACDNRGRTPLHYAVESGYIDQAVCLLQAGADPDLCFDNGLSAIQMAARDDKLNITKELIKFGASTRRVPGSGDRHRSALQWGVANGNQEICRCLVDIGVDMNELYPHLDVEHGRTPLMVAVRKGYKEAAEVLLSKGADINCKDESGKRAFDYAVEAGLMGNPTAEEVKILLLSYSNSRVVAGGADVKTMGQVASIILGASLYYINFASDVLVAHIYFKRKDTYWFALCLCSLLLPALLHAAYQFMKGFEQSAIRSFFILEPGFAAYESIFTGIQTPTYVACKNLEMAFQSVPQAILQGYSLLVHWNTWEWFSADFDVYALLVSILISCLSSFETASSMSVQNEDSSWKYSLKGYTGSFITAMYFMGDGFFHIVSYIVFAYTYQEYVFLLFACMFGFMFILLSIGFGINHVGSEVVTRALILSPLMSTLDFPMKPHLEKQGSWIIRRSVAISLVCLWTSNLLALLSPLKKLPDSEKDDLSSLSIKLAIMLAVATGVKLLTFYFIESQELAKGKNVELELSAFNAGQNLPSTLKLNVTSNPLASANGDAKSNVSTPMKSNRMKSVFVDDKIGSPAGPTKQWMRGDSTKSPLLENSTKVTLTSNPLHMQTNELGADVVSIDIT